MTVDELITELRRHPGGLRVYVRGYEEGIDDIIEVEPVKVHRDVHTAWCYGAHEMIPDDCGDAWTSDDDARSPDAAEPGLRLTGGREADDG